MAESKYQVIRNQQFKFGEQLKQIRNKKRLSVRKAAEQADLSSSFWSQVENCKREIPRNSTLVKMAKGLGMSVSEMFTLAGISRDYSDPAADFTPYSQNDMVDIPVLGEIACGDPILAQENKTGEYLATQRDDLPKGKLEDNFYLKCRGNSMYPTIPDGAYVLIHMQPDVENGDIAAVLMNDETEATLKRIQKQDNQVLLIPDNKEYSPFILNDDNPGKIIGKVIQMKVNF